MGSNLLIRGLHLPPQDLPPQDLAPLPLAGAVLGHSEEPEEQGGD
jgi:hypothetical protein